MICWWGFWSSSSNSRSVAMLIWGKKGSAGCPFLPQLPGVPGGRLTQIRKVPLGGDPSSPVGFGGSGWVVAWESEVWLVLVPVLT